MDQGSTRKRSAVHNFAPTVTKFRVMWEGQAPPPDTKFGNSRCEIVGRRVIFIWSLIHGSSWSGLIKVGPGDLSSVMLCGFHLRGISQEVLMNLIHYMCSETTHICFTRPQWVKGRKWLCYNKIGLFIYSFIYPFFFQASSCDEIHQRWPPCDIR